MVIAAAMLDDGDNDAEDDVDNADNEDAEDENEDKRGARREGTVVVTMPTSVIDVGLGVAIAIAGALSPWICM